MAVYSHSRIASFELCPYQYKLKYIDKVKVDIPSTIEAFMGSLVHEALEQLHLQKTRGVTLSMDEVVELYLKSWESQFSSDILIAKASQGLTADTYKLMGLKFIMDYYNRKKPFEGRQIVGLETKNRLKLTDKDSWYVMIDKLEKDEHGNYYVCDYKTNARMKTREETDSDRQLAMYAAWVKENFPDAKNVFLLWDMLAFNKEITSTRTKEELDQLKGAMIEKISQIENTTNFPQNPSPLCNYCVFKDICPMMNPQIQNPIPTKITQEKLSDY